MSDERLKGMIFLVGGDFMQISDVTTNKQHGISGFTSLTAATENGFEVIPLILRTTT